MFQSGLVCRRTIVNNVLGLQKQVSPGVLLGLTFRSLTKTPLGGRGGACIFGFFYHSQDGICCVILDRIHILNHIYKVYVYLYALPCPSLLHC